MTVLSRGARVRRGGRRPGWVLLTMLLVLAIGSSSALVFTNRVELLKLAVILALWAAVAGAFVSVLYRRQADIDQARARDLKLVYDLQLDREISARREYELTVESQLRRELAVELRAAAADEIAALRAELSSLRTNLEILFDADLEQRPALETTGRDIPAPRILTEHHPNGAQPSTGPPADWVSSDRITTVRQNEFVNRSDEAAIIDVPEVGVPPRPAASGRDFAVPPQPEPLVEPRHRTAPPPPPPAVPPQAMPPQGVPPQGVPPQGVPPQVVPPQGVPPHAMPPPAPKPPPPLTTPVEWQPATSEGTWAPPGSSGSHWVSPDPSVPLDRSSGRRRRYRNAEPEDVGPDPYGAVDAGPQYGGRRSRSRHSTEYRDFGVGRLGARSAGPAEDELPPPPPEAFAEPRPQPPAAPPPPPRLAPAPPAPPAPRHRGAEPAPVEPDASALHSDGQSVADLMARLQVQPSGGGRRRRRDG